MTRRKNTITEKIMRDLARRFAVFSCWKYGGQRHKSPRFYLGATLWQCLDWSCLGVNPFGMMLANVPVVFAGRWKHGTDFKLQIRTRQTAFVLLYFSYGGPLSPISVTTASIIGFKLEQGMVKMDGRIQTGDFTRSTLVSTSHIQWELRKKTRKLNDITQRDREFFQIC